MINKLIFKHDVLDDDMLTAYRYNSTNDGKLCFVPVAWIYETDNGLEVHCAEHPAKRFEKMSQVVHFLENLDNLV